MGILLCTGEDYSGTFKIGFCGDLPAIGTSIEALEIYSDLSSSHYQYWLDFINVPYNPKNYLCLQLCDASDISPLVMKNLVSLWIGDYNSWDNFNCSDITLTTFASSYGDGPDEDVDIYIKINGTPTNDADYSYVVKSDGNGATAFFDKAGNSFGQYLYPQNVVYLTYWTDSDYSAYADFGILDGDITISRPVYQGYKNACCSYNTNAYFYPWIAGSSNNGGEY